ncbi:MAG: penicillin-insensitive murein endopeptidase [Bradyrhizobiaceae bacterium]|nr:MAG: penicillin-insensitive murein endopeptidase [Bradyrhizobiaceae bacterium]
MNRARLILLSGPALILTAFLAMISPFAGAHAQDKGTLDARPLPPLAHPDDLNNAARDVFGRKQAPIQMPPQVIGFYAKGCIAGAQPLPLNGATWQVMRLSRNRYYGHPELIALLERLSVKAQKAGWPGLLVGDMSQPRGGPMLTGHASHQVGLDADIWLTPMPNYQLSRTEREDMSAVMMVRPDRLDIDPRVWTPQHLNVIRAAATEPQVERIFVNAAIKKALCREAKGERSWLSKVRPMYGHDYHFHIRIKCPAGSTTCESQPPPPEGEGCSTDDLAYWFSDAVLHPRPPVTPPKPRPPITLAQMPPECRQIALAP